MAPQQILYVSRTAKGGAAFSLYHLIKGLDKSRYTPIVLFYTLAHTFISDKLTVSGVRVITLSTTNTTDQVETTSISTEHLQRRDIARWLTEHVGKVVAETYTFLKSCYQFLRGELLTVWPILRTIRENQIDLVHVNDGLRHGKPSIIAARLAKVSCVCHIRMFAELNYFDKIFIPLVNHFIYISRAIADDNINQGTSPAKGTVIPNAVDLADFSITYDVESVRDEFGWTAGEPIVGVVGRLDWWKGHEYFLEAIAALSHQFPKLRGLIIGQPENSPTNRAYFQKLKSMTDSLDLGKKVVFTGFRGDIPRLMAALDVVVLSSSSPEPFGRVVIEGMAAGKPVVATAAGGVLDIVEDGVDGLLVPCGDSAAMAQAIQWLLTNPDKADQMGLAARQRVAEEFTVERHGAAIQGVYGSLINVTQGNREIRSVTLSGSNDVY